MEKLALPEEQPVLADLLRSLAKVNPRDPKAMLIVLDQILAQLPRPTMLRGVVQTTRAVAFEAIDKHAEATAAIEEAIRLLPDYAGPLLTAAGIYLYSNNPGLASDAIIRASEIDPEDVRRLPDYEASGVMHRFAAIRDHKRARLFSERLLAIGWTGSGVRNRSELAEMAIRQAVDDGDLAKARLLVPNLLNPETTYSLLADNTFRAVWPDFEAWSGPQLSVQWNIFVNEARKRWLASNDLERGADYAAALRTAGAYDALIAEFLPLFGAPLDAERDWHIVYIAPKVAGALLARGRTADAIGLYDRAMLTWPIGVSANALNLYANRANTLLYSDRPADALVQIDAAIEDSHRWQGEINIDAIAGMHHIRACALHALGRDAEAVVSASIAAQAGHAKEQAEVALCMGNPAAAKAALIRALARPDERSGVIDFLQPDELPVVPTAYGRAGRSGEIALRHDPQVLAALAPYGRILSYSLSAGAPRP